MWENMSDIEFDKLLEQYTLKIPEITKNHLDKIPPILKKKLNKQICLLMAEVIHESKFDPLIYLRSDESNFNVNEV